MTASFSERVTQIRYALHVLEDGELHYREKLFPDARKEAWPTEVLKKLQALGLVHFEGSATRYRKYKSLVDRAELKKVDPKQILMMKSPLSPLPHGVNTNPFDVSVEVSNEGEPVDEDEPTAFADQSDEHENDISLMLAQRLSDMTSAIVSLHDKASSAFGFAQTLEAHLKESRSQHQRLEKIFSRSFGLEQGSLDESLETHRKESRDEQKRLYGYLIQDLELILAKLMNKAPVLAPSFPNEAVEAIAKTMKSLTSIAEDNANRLTTIEAQMGVRNKEIVEALNDVRRETVIALREVTAAIDQMSDTNKASIASVTDGTKALVGEFVEANKRFVNKVIEEHETNRKDLESLVALLLDEEKTARGVMKRIANGEPVPRSMRGNVTSTILAYEHEKQGKGKKR